MSLLKKSRRYSVFYFLASLFLVSPTSAQTFNKEKLQELALNYVQSQLPSNESVERQLNALSLDSRIPNRDCKSELNLTIPTEPPFNRQVTVQLKCEDLVGWSQYVHIRIVELAPVIVASESLARGGRSLARSI